MSYKAKKINIGIQVPRPIYGSALKNITKVEVALPGVEGHGNLIYYEACFDEQDARSREKYLKTGMGKRYLKNSLKRFLSLTG